jgi:segregation and condensation protein B
MKSEDQPQGPEPSEPRQGLSFRALREAFAQVLAARKNPSEEPPAETPPAAEPAISPARSARDLLPPDSDDDEDRLELDPRENDDSCQLSPRTILEAMLFVGSPANEPLASVRVAELMRGVQPEEIPDLVAELNHRYTADGCPYQIVSEGSGYRLVLRQGFDGVRDRLYGRIREARLSPAAIDVLSLLAYRQPLTAEEIGRLRGLPSNHLLAQLVGRQLLRIQRSETPGQRPLYYTTHRFLELFGLESLEDLPQVEDV